MHIRRLLAVLAALALFLTACGGGDTAATDTAEAPEVTKAPEGADAAEPAESPEAAAATDAAEESEPARGNAIAARRL